LLDLPLDALEEAKQAVRSELGSRREYIRSGHEVRRHELARKILSLFNGRNAREVARELDISRATVYRLLKQPGIAEKLSQVTARLETNGTVVSAQPTAPLASKAAETD
jgi:Mor family transcriptional regulator